MEVTREERQQMRQRGAGTRKAKEVDFGFSFGSPLAQPSAPAPLATVPEPQNPPQTQTAPATTPPLKPSQPILQDSRAERTHGSARNKLPERPSTYDIPPDRGEQTQSNKRRKLSSNNNTEDTHIRQGGVRAENGDPQLVNDSASHTKAQPSYTQEIPYMTTLEQQEKRSNGPSEPLISPIPEPSTDYQTRRDKASNGVEQEIAPAISAAEGHSAQASSSVPSHADPTSIEESRTSPKAPEPQLQVAAIQPENAEQTSENRHKSQAWPSREQEVQRSKRAVVPMTQQIEKSIARGVQRASPAEALETNHAPTLDADVENIEEVPELRNESMEKENRGSQDPSTKMKKPRGRPGRKAIASQSPELPGEDIMQESVTITQEEPASLQAGVASKLKRSRGRPAHNKKAIGATESENTPPQPVSVATEASSGPRRGRKPISANPDDQQDPVIEPTVPKPQRGRPGKKVQPPVESAPVVEADVEPEAHKLQRGRPANKSKRAVEPEELQTEEAEAVSKSRRERSGKKARHAVEPEPEPEPAVEELPGPEMESAAPKLQRGRPGKPKRNTEPEPELHVEAESRHAEPRRKTREPRGETVAVTVYRLANVTSLNGTVSTAEGLGDDQDSADELTTNQRTKMPSRGGVNPADVLSQICRETLEKTLNTLKDGIANEANATRRAEWTRKRKAVETFGSELESRLMDLSGILDSNFVLGVQLKKTKRDMMDLRSHLYRVRRERESVALQMDAVRSKHTEEEKAKTSRTIINNSLHSLELALDRNKQRPASTVDPSPADLEFMLRTVAGVSARAPEAQGGLLNQIRAFNAQLESTASRLER